MIFDVVAKEGQVLGQLKETEDVWQFHRLLGDGRLHHEDDFTDLDTAIMLLNQSYGGLEMLENTAAHMIIGEPVLACECMGPEIALRFADTVVHIKAVLSEGGLPYLELARSVPKGPPLPDGITAEDAGVLSLLSVI